MVDTPGVRGVDVSDTGLEKLSKLLQLRDLNLGHGRFTDKGLVHLKALPRLESLRMVRTRTTDAGLAHIGAIKSLRRLTLDYTKVTDKGIEALRALPLEELTLDSTDITDKGAEVLAGIRSLKSLDLYHTLISEQCQQRIKSSLPDCSIFWDKDSALPTRRHL